MSSPQKPVEYFYRHYEHPPQSTQQQLGSGTAPLEESSGGQQQASPLHHLHQQHLQQPLQSQGLQYQSYIYSSIVPMASSTQGRSHSHPHSQLADPRAFSHYSTSHLQKDPSVSAHMPPQYQTQVSHFDMPQASIIVGNVSLQTQPQPQPQPQPASSSSPSSSSSSSSSLSSSSQLSPPSPANQQQLQQNLGASPGHQLRYSGSPHQQRHQQYPSIPATPQSRRRSVPKLAADIDYPMNYPAHPIPPHMQVTTGPPNSWTVAPPRPENIRSRRYASGVDERNFFSVLEYEINNQPIIWDYYTGYVHLTGIWKAIGNSKADIVKLLDNSPELEPVIKRVRGGFLKIQGTWVPFDVARRLAIHVCYYIRYALVPLFGPEFPFQCTKPYEPMFGLLQLTMPPKKEGPSKAPRPYQTLQQQQQQQSVGTVGAESPKSASLTPTLQSPSVHRTSGLTRSHSGSVLAATKVSTYPAPSPPHQHQHPHHHAHAAHSHSHHTHSHNHRRQSETGFKRRNSSSRSRSTSASITAPIRKDSIKRSFPVNNELYDENVFDDDDTDWVSPPPMPRKVSFSDEQKVSGSPSEFLAMLKATRSLQQMSAGRPVKDVGGDFECAGRQFVWDGSDRLDVLPSRTENVNTEVGRNESTAPGDLLNASHPKSVNGSSNVPEPEPKKPEPTPPMEPVRDRRLPSFATILNV